MYLMTCSGSFYLILLQRELTWICISTRTVYIHHSPSLGPNVGVWGYEARQVVQLFLSKAF